jgi:hypothetical protein
MHPLVCILGCLVAAAAAYMFGLGVILGALLGVEAARLAARPCRRAEP